MAAANDGAGNSVDTALGVVEEGGKRLVCLRYHQPVTVILFEPQNAFEIAEGLARAAYEARFGKPPPDDGMGELFRQVRNRVTDDMRNKLVEEHTHHIASMMRQNKDPATIARETVDVILGRVA